MDDRTHKTIAEQLEADRVERSTAAEEMDVTPRGRTATSTRNRISSTR
jgi:hypothetical protein